MIENGKPLYALTVEEFKRVFFEVIREGIQKVVTDNAKEDDAYLSVDEACALLKISRPSLYQLFKDSKLKKKKLNGRTIIKRKDIDDLLK